MASNKRKRKLKSDSRLSTGIALVERKIVPARFDPAEFLAKAGLGKTLLVLKKKQLLFSQGDAADSVFYVQDGKVKVTVVSEQGKEAVVAVVPTGDF